MDLLTEDQFQLVADVAKRQWGLHLTDNKRHLVASRLQRFVRQSRFGDVAQYVQHIARGASEAEKLEFFDLLSTNVTSFFREQPAFDFLERELWTPLDRGTLTRPGRKVRLWSAACSTGAEPFSMAIHAHEHLKDLGSWDVRILASDLSNSALATARTATYPSSMIEGMDDSVRRRWFERQPEGRVRVRAEARSMVSFKQINLIEPFPVRGPFDVVFLRNCMIYFDRPTRERLVRRVADVLAPGGVFVIGSSESLSGLDVPFRSRQPAVYEVTKCPLPERP